MTVAPARYGPPAIFTWYDRNGNVWCAVAKRPQLFHKNPNQISARNLSFSHAPPPGPDGTLFGFGRAVQSEGKAPKVPSGGDTVAREGLASSGR